MPRSPAPSPERAPWSLPEGGVRRRQVPGPALRSLTDWSRAAGWASTWGAARWYTSAWGRRTWQSYWPECSCSPPRRRAAGRPGAAAAEAAAGGAAPPRSPSRGRSVGPSSCWGGWSWAPCRHRRARVSAGSQGKTHSRHLPPAVSRQLAQGLRLKCSPQPGFSCRREACPSTEKKASFSQDLVRGLGKGTEVRVDQGCCYLLSVLFLSLLVLSALSCSVKITQLVN